MSQLIAITNVKTIDNDNNINSNINSNNISNSSNNGNIDTNTNQIQELLNLVKSLYKIIEGLNARLERFERNENVDVKNSNTVDKIISSSKNANETSINVSKSSKFDHPRTVHENAVSPKCLGNPNGSSERVEELALGNVHENVKPLRCAKKPTF